LSFRVRRRIVPALQETRLWRAGLSKGVGFIRFDQRCEAEQAIGKLHGTIPDGFAEPITVKFANNPSNNPKATNLPLAAYLTPQMRRFPGPIHHTAAAGVGSRFRYIPLSPLANA
jgi:ELAV like protein 2/3/4